VVGEKKEKQIIYLLTDGLSPSESKENIAKLILHYRNQKVRRFFAFSLFTSHLLLVTLYFLTAPKISATPPSKSTPIHT
jgi:hypothetical protein